MWECWVEEKAIFCSSFGHLAFQTFNTNIFHVGGTAWQRWNVDMRTLLPANQEQRGREAGSWSPALDLYGVKGGRLFTTALSACMLETYYRHLPLFAQGTPD